jgi:transcriptional regulator with XRE-family HTH domain
MSTKTGDELMARLQATSQGETAHLSAVFLAQVYDQMLAQGVSSAALAERLGSSRSYVTRLFRGSTNLSVQTMVKLARALDSSVHIELAAPPVSELAAPQVSHARTQA